MKGSDIFCGHDIHTVIGLGIANVLANQKENIDGTIYFIFQPSEEDFKGAKAMIDDGLFEIIKPDEIYGIHITPSKAGTIAAKSGEMYAYNRGIRIKFKSDNDENELKKVIQPIIRGLSRNKADSKPWEVENMADSAVGLVNPETIYKDYLIVSPNIQVTKNRDNISLDFSVYETNKNNLESIPLKIKEQILKTKYKDELYFG